MDLTKITRTERYRRSDGTPDGYDYVCALKERDGSDPAIKFLLKDIDLPAGSHIEDGMVAIWTDETDMEKVKSKFQEVKRLINEKLSAYIQFKIFMDIYKQEPIK